MDATRPVTAKGRATRERIVDAAAELAHRRGIHGTTNPEVRAAAGVSGSQLGHYFPDKESLIRAVLAKRAGQVVELTRGADGGGLDSLDALRAWADSYTRIPDVWEGGCRFGSLSSEILKTDPEIAGDVRAGFDRWLALFSGGLTAMRERGELKEHADPNRLAVVLLAAFEGGMLLAQAQRDTAPLATALDAAIDYIRTFTDQS